MNNLKDARQKRFTRASEQAAKRRAVNKKAWGKWSRNRQRRQKKAGRMHTERPAVISSDAECFDTIGQIVTICERATLPNAARYLAACLVYLREKPRELDALASFEAVGTERTTPKDAGEPG